MEKKTSLTDALSGVVAFGYDDVGQLTSLTDPNDETWTYAYDDLGNRASVTDPLSNVTEFVYDDRGQLTERTDGRGVETAWTYDERGLPTSVTFPGGDVTYAYDDAGRRTSMVDDTGTTTFTYDDAGQMSSVAAPAGTIAYDWDEAGRRTAMTLPGGREIDYGYDLAGQLDSLTDPSDDETTFSYDEDGRRIEIDRSNGVVSTYTYDDAGRISSIDHVKDAATLASFDYTYDDRGLRTSMTTQAGTETYAHDDLGQLIAVEYADSEEVSYTYDDAGNRLTETRDSVTTTYTYDDAGRIESVGAASATNDDAGNLTNLGTDEYSYDYDNRLLSATANGHDTTYTYDGDGVRVSSEVDSTPVDYLVDREGGFPVVVDDGSHAYLHADGPIEATGGGDLYPLTDALGSVRAVTNASGTVVGSRSYEVFGATESQSGTVLGFGFTGEPEDAAGGIYLRARTLDPGLGRFLQSDTMRPAGPGSLAYNLYAYAQNAPTTWVDPSGNQVLVMKVAGALAATKLAVSGLEAFCLRFFTREGCIAAARALTVSAFTAIALVFACTSDDVCRGELPDILDLIKKRGSYGLAGVAGVLLGWTIRQLLQAASDEPAEPSAEDPCAQTQRVAGMSLIDSAQVVRGGQNLPTDIVRGAVTIDALGRVHGVSVQAGLESLEILVGDFIPHGQLGVTTVGAIRAAGGLVTPAPGPFNEYHSLVSCVPPETLSSLLRPTIKNPFK